MSICELQEEIVELISQISGVEKNMNREANLYLDVGVASFHALQLLTELEERYDLQIPDEEFVEATSVNKITSMIEKLKDSQSGAMQDAG